MANTMSLNAMPPGGPIIYPDRGPGGPIIYPNLGPGGPIIYP